MTTTIPLNVSVPQDTYRPTWLAPQSVSCPKCHTHPGHACKSTGGGNTAEVAFHRARRDRIAGWTADQLADAHELVKANRPGWGRWVGLDVPADTYTATEASAAPIAKTPAKTPTPKGVRLSEKQAEYIENAVQGEQPGQFYYPTAHFHGCAEIRQTLNALEAKGIAATVKGSTDYYGKHMRLTPFGWQVYRHHRLIIRRLTDAQIDAQEAAAAATQCAICVPDATGPECDDCFIAEDAHMTRLTDI